MGPAVAALVLILTGTAGAQRDAARPAAGSGVIRGSVVAADTGAPISDALVSLRDAAISLKDTAVVSTATGAIQRSTDVSRTRTARLNADGRFEFVGVLPGRYRLAVDPGQTAARYLPARYPDPDIEPSTPLSVTGNQVIDQVVIPLPRAAAITGRVVNHSGSPIAMAIVMAQEAMSGDRLRPAQGFSLALGDRTDDTGSFRIFGLRPGAYVVTAQPMRESFISVDGATGIISGGVLPPTYFPGTVSPSDATRIRVRSGDEHGPIEIIVSPARFLTVRGVLLDPDGQPAANVNLSLQRPTLGLGVTTQGSSAKADGTFEIRDVPPGEHAIVVNRYGAPGSQYAFVPLRVYDDIEGLTVRLQPGVTIKGQVLFEGIAPAPLPTMYVRSVSARYGSRSGAPSGVMPAPDLSFTLEHQFGPTLIRADPPPGWHLKSVLHDGRDVTDEPTEFGEAARVQVVLTQRAASLTGVVTTASGDATQGSVVVLSEDPALWHERASATTMVSTAGDGKYRVEGLRAGRYLVVAIPKEEPPTPGMTPAYFELLAKHATTLTIGDGESKTLDLKRVALQ